MPKRQVPQSEYDAILLSLAKYPDGAYFSDIQNNLVLSLPYRTLQRHLNHLVKIDLIKAEGKTKGLRYRLHQVNLSGEIPLSHQGKLIHFKMEQPLLSRNPVSYNRDFLDQYRPNESRYLSEEVCLKLAEMGKTDGESPAGTFALQILQRLLVDLSWNSSRLEGNTYSLLETERLLELSEVVKGKDLKEAQMILNHKDAIEFLIRSSKETGINRQTILNLHALLSSELLGDSEACGRLRDIPIGIGKSVYQPLAVPHLIDECFNQILHTAAAIKNPFEQAFFLMVHLPYLHPFIGVNKRVSRLAVNIPLIRYNLSPLSFIDVPYKPYINGLLGVYELNELDLLRDVFIWAYERSARKYTATRKELGDPDPFKIRYKQTITDAVSTIVRQKVNKTQGVNIIKQFALKLPLSDQPHFIEAVERELIGLHEGNFARHHLEFNEFLKWQKSWI